MFKVFRLLVYLKYLVPNLFTCLSIFFAYLAFDTPDVVDRCWYLLLCVIMDKLDGTSARVLKATSKFGLKFDSIADAIAFGLLPGIIIYEASAFEGVTGYWAYGFKISGVVYIIATFARLYKFDRMAKEDESPDVFFGIPSTLAAAVFAAYCVTFGHYFEEKLFLVFLLPIIGVLLSLLMNGNFPTLKVGVPERKSLRILQTLAFIFVFIAIPLKKSGPGLFLMSVLVLFITIYGGRKKLRAGVEQVTDEEVPVQNSQG